MIEEEVQTTNNGLALICNHSGRIIDILFDGCGIQETSSIDPLFITLVDEESTHKAENFFRELIDQNMAYNWELNTITKNGLSTYRFSGISWGENYLIVAAPSNFEMSKLMEQFMNIKKNEQSSDHPLEDIAHLSCEQEQKDRELFDEITNLNNELVSLQRELAKKNTQLTRLNQDLEQRVEERTQKIQHLLRQKDNFITHLGHDLKTPLGPIINLIPIIQEKEQDEHLKEMLQIMSNSAKKLHNLVQKTMKYIQVTSSEFRPNYQTLSLHAILQKTLDEKREELHRNQFMIDNQIDPGFQLVTDPDLIKDVFDELIGNIIKYSQNGGTIAIHSRIDAQNTLISIADTGMGLTQEQISSVFDEFYKTDESRHDLNSHGLGLSIIRTIINRMGGDIWVESQGPGEGSTFHFSLPMTAIEGLTSNNQ